jgi:hypothetical protein
MAGECSKKRRGEGKEKKKESKLTDSTLGME